MSSSFPPALLDEARRVLSRVAGGAALADVYLQDRRDTALVLDDGRIERAVEPVTRGGAVRLLDEGGALRFAHAAALHPEALRRMATRVGGRGREVSFHPLAVAEATVARPYENVRLDRKVARLKEAEAAARAVSPAVAQVRVVYRDTANDIAIANDLGRVLVEERRGVYFSILVTATRGELSQTAHEAVGGSGGWELFCEHPVEELARTAARRAVALLDTAPPPAGVLPVVLGHTAGGTMIHEAIGHGLEADLVAEASSVFKGKVGAQVASPLVTVVDDPTLPGRFGSYRFDDEGIDAAPTVLVRDGVLQGYLHARKTAREMALRPTGNGRREAYGLPPIARMSNTYIAPRIGDDAAAILADTPGGLYVTRMGGGEVNITNGDFVFEVLEGFRIEGGKAGEPVRNTTLAGNGPAQLMSIDRVADALTFCPGTCGKDGQGVPVSDAQPTLRLPAITVGGA